MNEVYINKTIRGYYLVINRKYIYFDLDFQQLIFILKLYNKNGRK